MTCGYAAARFSRYHGGEYIAGQFNCAIKITVARFAPREVGVDRRQHCHGQSLLSAQLTDSGQLREPLLAVGAAVMGKINPAAVAVMAERRIDISGEYPKPWTGEIIAAADVIVSMGCGDAVPALPGRRYEDWDLDDPAGKDVAEVRLIRDEIERRVRELLDDLRIPYRS